MNSNGENFDNSLDSALNMSQDEIEKLINGQFQMDEDVPEYETADLESLLSELESMEDEDIQEISDLLDKADNNEAVDQDIMDLLNMPDESEEITAYNATDLFSADEGSQKKEGFFKRLLAKFKKISKEKEEVTEGAELDGEAVQNFEEKSDEPPESKKKKEKRKKDKKKKAKEAVEQTDKPQEEDRDILELQDDALNGSDAIILELEKEALEKKEEQVKEKPKKAEKSKKKKDKSKKKTSETEEEGEEGSSKKEKKAKEKKVKEKKVKEKPVVLYDYDEAPVTKKKVCFIFFICIMLLLAVLALIINFAGHRNKKLAEEAYEQGDYLQCYQLLYGQHLSEGQEVLYHKSKIHLKMDALWNRYNEYMKTNQPLRGLDKLVQFVYEYPEISVYAQEWNCKDVTDSTYNEVLDILFEEYKLSEADTLAIANILDDVEYTKALTILVEKREKGLLKYPNMLPEEEERIEESQEAGEENDSNY